MSKFGSSVATALVFAAGIPATARAVEVTRRFDVDFRFAEGTVPAIAGSFTVRYDDALDYTDAPAVVIASTLGFPIDSALSFTKVGHEFLAIGGVDAGAYYLARGERDYSLSMAFPVADGSAAFYTSKYSLANGQTVNAASGTVRVTTLTEAVPEPAAWGMMAGGLGVAGGALRRRRRMAPGAQPDAGANPQAA